MKRIYQEEVINLVNHLIAKEFDAVIQDSEMHDKICHAVDLKKEAKLDGDDNLVARIEKAFEIYESDEFEAYFVKNYTNFNSVEEYRQSLEYEFDEDDDEDDNFWEPGELYDSRCCQCRGHYCDLYDNYINILDSESEAYDCPKGYLLSLAEKKAKADAEAVAEAAAADDENFDRYYGLR